MNDTRPHSDPARRPRRREPLSVRDMPKRVLTSIKNTWPVIILIAIILAVVAVLVSIPYLTHDAVAAQVGDCLDGDSRVVSCTSTKARYRVLGIVGHGRGPDIEDPYHNLQPEVCAAFPATDTTYWRRGTNRSGSGFVLCLSIVRR
jgi:hypothetical protein